MNKLEFPNKMHVKIKVTIEVGKKNNLKHRSQIDLRFVCISLSIVIVESMPSVIK